MLRTVVAIRGESRCYNKIERSNPPGRETCRAFLRLRWVSPIYLTEWQYLPARFEHAVNLCMAASVSLSGVTDGFHCVVCCCRIRAVAKAGNGARVD
jgi:hypothetical protein